LDVLGPLPFPEPGIIYRYPEYACLYWRLKGLEIWQDLLLSVKLLRGPKPMDEKLSENIILRPDGTRIEVDKEAESPTGNSGE